MPTTDLLHKHDLPPKWDGRLVIWLGWEYVPITTLHLHDRSRPVCEGCGMPSYERGFPCWSANWGLRASSSLLTVEDFHCEEAKRAALPPSLRGKVTRHFWRDITAFRCHHCQLDTVWDTEADEMWTLDHADYGDDGSVA